MHSSKKGNQWYFGMKAHVGVDASSGLVHTAGVTSGNVHDAKVMDRLVRDDDTAVYGDKGYASDAKKRAAEATGVLWAVKEKAKPGGRLTARQRARNRRVGKVRAKVEHVFRVIKCQFGYRKVRYRGIAKNGAQVFSLLALANLYLALARKTIRAGGDVLFAGRSGRTTGELPVLKAADKRWKSCRAQHTIRFSSSGDGRRFWQRHAVI